MNTNSTEDKSKLVEYKKTNKFLRLFGPIIFLVGLILLIVSITNFMNGGFDYAGLPFIAMPLCFVGGVMSMFGYMGTLSRYTSSQTAPVAKDVTNYMLENTKESIGSVVKEISENLTETIGIKECPKCNHKINPNARFCDECGSLLYKVCPSCNTENDFDAKFCQSCGIKI